MSLKKRFDEEQYRQCKELIRKFGNATNKEIGEMIKNGCGGVSDSTVGRVRKSKDYADFLSNRRKQYSAERNENHEEDLNTLVQAFAEAMQILKNDYFKFLDMQTAQYRQMISDNEDYKKFLDQQINKLITGIKEIMK